MIGCFSHSQPLSLTAYLLLSPEQLSKGLKLAEVWSFRLFLVFKLIQLRIKLCIDGLLVHLSLYKWQIYYFQQLFSKIDKKGQNFPASTMPARVRNLKHPFD